MPGGSLLTSHLGKKWQELGTCNQEQTLFIAPYNQLHLREKMKGKMSQQGKQE